MEEFKKTLEEFGDWHQSANQDVRDTMISLINKIDALKQIQSQHVQKIIDNDRKIYQLEADKEKLQHMVNVLTENNKMLSEHNSRQDGIAQCAVQLANANFASAATQSGNITPLNTSSNQTI